MQFLEFPHLRIRNLIRIDSESKAVGQAYLGSHNGCSPLVSRGKAPARGLGDEVPQKLKSFCRLMRKFPESENATCC